ncbi:MBOAT family O-acyltransferase [Janthinobacterium sp.]|uniref:MBOAT family O-acyltransferase n=1 Tax=Janthinobacterium sp. TaxID=1871054 RepID=UPI00293DA023|nr:MBOAT family O-acyltransferase [Janthinobacterium sp.]
MLFNSFSFLFFYLPVVLAGYFCLGRLGAAWSTAWLAAASLFFYAYWDLRFLPLLLLSVVVNYRASGAIAAAPAGAPRRRRRLWAALAFNLGALAYFKYANFFVAGVNSLGAGLPAPEIVLPIGISFFTFTQIAFLVDVYRDAVRERRFLDYLLFVSYFPHLIAGPVLHHKEMMPQFADPANARPRAANFAVGLSIFVVGLAKKVLIADNLAPMVAPVFAAGAHPQLLEAWIGALAFTFQLYFDFSGYSDMAIGLSLLFGVKLPLNFASPYKSANIRDFWRRWHMTLSRFLRNYLYIALGGGRAGPWLRCRNLMLTMLLGGLWHGAGWTFIVWGGLHGLYLVLHQGWRRLAGDAPPRWWGAPLTFLAVLLAWVLFRAPDLATAADILGALGGANGLSLPHGLAGHAAWFARLGVQPVFGGIRWIDFSAVGMPVLALAALLAFAAPNTQELFAAHRPCIDAVPQGPRRLAWTPGRRWAVALSALLTICVVNMNRVSEFLYFQF